MEKNFGYDSSKDQIFLKYILLGFGVFFVGISFFFASPKELIEGLWHIITHSDKLITDYFQIAGFGPTFFNAGLIMVLTVWMIDFFKAPFEGSSIAAVFLMGGFAMFGKNLVNIWSIIFGAFLYSVYTKTSFSRYIFTAFWATSLSPIVTEVALFRDHWTLSFLSGFIIGALIGFFIPAISAFTVSTSQGYNLYNTGFAAGLLGTVITSIMKTFGYTPELSMHWYSENKPIIMIILYGLFTFFCLLSILLDRNVFKSYPTLTRHSGRMVSNFILLDGLPVVLLNMGLLGIVYTSYVLLVGGILNGPTIGGIFTIVGFAGFGMHLKNSLPVVLGVAIGAVLGIWGINDPSVLLAALFSTGLAPISGTFGPIAGLVTGFIHISVVLNVGLLHGGLNLYNNGFGAGLVAIFLLPLLEIFHTERERRKGKQNETHQKEISQNS